MNTLSPSRLFREAAGIAPKGQLTMPDDGCCAQCAAPIHRGEPAASTALWITRESFNNKFDLGVPESPYVCSDCCALYHKDYLQKYSKSYACRAGVFRLASNAEQCWFLLHPPEPPFIALISDTQQQHLIWRAPVNWSAEQIKVRMGDRVLLLRHKVLLQAVEAVARCSVAMEKAGLKGRHPFQKLDRELGNMEGTAIRRDVQRIAAGDAAVSADLALLEALSLGELWGLTVLIVTDPASIVEPRRMLPSETARAR
jgi:CRISPR type IV-associated protein Csf1